MTAKIALAVLLAAGGASAQTILDDAPGSASRLGYSPSIFSVVPKIIASWARNNRAGEPALSISQEQGEGTPALQILSQPRNENDTDFDSDFYRQFPSRSLTLQLDTDARTYLFPTLYADVTSAVALFTCSYERAAKLLREHPEIKPVEMGFGRSAVLISSYRYNKVRGIAPYNEIAVSIPVVAKDDRNPTLLSKGVGYFVISMPVTTRENYVRGHKLWGLPKVVEQIDLYTENGDYVTAAHDESGKEYLRFSVPMSGESKTESKPATIYSVLEGRLVGSITTSQGTFAESTFKKNLLPKRMRESSGLVDEPAFLTLGESDSAAMLKALEIDAQPFEVRFGRHISSAFDLPSKELSAP